MCASFKSILRQYLIQLSADCTIIRYIKLVNKLNNKKLLVCTFVCQEQTMYLKSYGKIVFHYVNDQWSINKQGDLFSTQLNLISTLITLVVKVCYDWGTYFRIHYPDQYPDQDPCPEEFNADALCHVSVSVKRIFLFYLTFNCVDIIYIFLQENATPFTQNEVTT